MNRVANKAATGIRCHSGRAYQFDSRLAASVMIASWHCMNVQ